MDTQSPFSLSEVDALTLEQSDGFRVVRAHLSTQENHSFCSSHSSVSQSSQQTFILHRDILHSLLLPLLQIHSQAAVFATQAISQQAQNSVPRSPISPRSEVDLEVAFRGAARGAFSWLQCFVAEERDWCSTQGCPACVVLKVMHSEPFIRIVVASCRLSGHLKDMLQDAEQGDKSRTLSTGSTLPEFKFWQSAVHQAVSDDDFWGLHFWEDIEARAEDLELGVKDLIRQCSDICSPSPIRPSYRRAVTFGGLPCGEQSQPVVENDNLVKLPSKIQEEEQVWMRKTIEACWLALVQEAAYKRRNSSASTVRRHSSFRMRSLTT